MAASLGFEVTEAARRGDPVALARMLVATPSVNPTLAPGGAGEGQIAALCADWLDGWGLRPEVIEAAPGRDLHA